MDGLPWIRAAILPFSISDIIVLASCGITSPSGFCDGVVVLLQHSDPNINAVAKIF